MGGMTAILVVAVIAVAGAVVARVTWRRPADERHSIQSHQQTLETLRSMADRRAGGQHDRTGSAGSDANAAAPRPPRARSGPAHAGTVRSAPARPGAVRAPAPPAPPSTNGQSHDDLVFVDDAAVRPSLRTDEPARIAALSMPKGLPRAGRRRGRGPRRGAGSRLAPVVATVVVLGLVVGVALALAPGHHPPSSLHRTTPPKKTSSRVSHSVTTVPPPPVVQPTASTASTAAYTAPSTGYTVALKATGLCWVEATEVSTGTVVWTGTLQLGQTRSIPATGSLFLRLGAANDISVTMNGEQVVMPTGFHSPFDMQFQST
jgi:hypothetical protein